MNKGFVGSVDSVRVKSLPSSPSSLLVTGSVSDELVNILSKAGLLQSQSSSVELHFERVASLMDHEPSAHMLLFYKRPESLIADALKRGDSLEATAEDWRQHAESVLSLFRRYRCRTTMIDRETACSQPKQMLATLNDRLGINLNMPAATSPISKEQDTHFERLISRCFVREDIDMRFLLAEIEAGSVSHFTENKPHLAKELLELRDQVINERTKTEKTKQDHEFQLLRLHQAQEELEIYVQQNQELKNSLDAVTHQLKESEQDTEGARIDLRDTRAKLHSKEKALEQMRQSGSWKITAPLRKLLGLFQTNKA